MKALVFLSLVFFLLGCGNENEEEVGQVYQKRPKTEDSQLPAFRVSQPEKKAYMFKNPNPFWITISKSKEKRHDAIIRILAPDSCILVTTDKDIVHIFKFRLEWPKQIIEDFLTSYEIKKEAIYHELSSSEGGYKVEAFFTGECLVE